MDAYQRFIFKTNIARHPDETFEQVVARYRNFFARLTSKSELATLDEYLPLVLSLDVIPSTRCLWAAGPALESDSAAGYHCAYTPIESTQDIAEVAYLLMCGCGVGVSVERQYINKLPTVKPQSRHTKTVVFADSREGWAVGIREMLDALYEGLNVEIDTSQVRPRGAPLKTFGGTASGPQPLHDLLAFARNVFAQARGSKLSSEQVADIVCKMAEGIVCGGVRRSAMIILTNPSDRRMAQFKVGNFWRTAPHRSYANISLVYTDRPSASLWLTDWLDIITSGTGERGVVNRLSLVEWALRCGRDPDEFGLNPCGEIILRPKQFCNLAEVVVRPHDTLADLVRKVQAATFFAVLQSRLKDFKFISRTWSHNMTYDPIIGVSLTGLRDHPVLNHVSQQAREWLQTLRETSHESASASGFKATTCVKPSGTTSQLAACSPGLHPRLGRYVLRRVRVSTADPMYWRLKERGLLSQWDTVDFAIEAPETSVLQSDVTALEQLSYWKLLKLYYCDHNPSATVLVDESEWTKVVSWCYENFSYLGGLTFLPHAPTYEAMPYEAVDYGRFLEVKAREVELDVTPVGGGPLVDCGGGGVCGLGA